MNSVSITLFVLPSMRIGGGSNETIRLASELRTRGADSRIVSLWKHPISAHTQDPSRVSDVPVTYLSQLPPRKLRAPFDVTFLWLRFRSFLRNLVSESGNNEINVVLTHYSTLPFGWFVPRARRYCFVQGEEWKFLPPGPLQRALRRFIFATFRRSQVITANAYLTQTMSSAGIAPLAEARIWAAPDFAAQSSEERDLDLVVVLRRGYPKRLDLYLELLNETRKIGLKSAVITSEDAIAFKACRLADVCILRPTLKEMKSIYQQSKLFILLSEREGFGLPPLEAMGAGCVPICRDSGGVRCYMVGSLAQNLVPLEAPLEVILGRLRALLANPKLLSSLSVDAREIFLNGARQAAEHREQALACLCSI
jgi:glycosyltransferase involved in cell wall biosynthesis